MQSEAGLSAAVKWEAEMTDTADTAYARDMANFNRHIMEAFRVTGGQPEGMPTNSPILILHTVGAKSGRELESPLVYHRDGDRLYVFASANGADRHPAWYHNLVANPDVRVEIGTETLPLRATVLTGEERDRVYREQTERATQFAGYQQKTSRVIPVIALHPA